MGKPLTPCQNQSPALRCSARQRGVVLFIVMIALVVMMLSCLAMFRSVDTSILLAGNSAFRKAATQASDLGIEAAAAALPGIINLSQDSLIPGQYYPSLTPASGGLSWDPATGLPPSAIWTGATVVAGTPDGYSVVYIIERMCTGTLPVTNMLVKCVADPAPDNSSSKSGAVKFTASSAYYYRVTVRATGPHKTISYVQAMLSD